MLYRLPLTGAVKTFAVFKPFKIQCGHVSKIFVSTL